MKRDFRKPLVVFNNKKLLRYKHACSELNEFSLDTRFTRIYPETHKDSVSSPESIQKVVVCSGQAYYAALEKRQQDNIKDMVIIRVE